MGNEQDDQMVTDMLHVLQLRRNKSTSHVDAKAIAGPALRPPVLKRLFLEHNELDDDATVLLTVSQQRLALRHLRLDNNDVSSTTARSNHWRKYGWRANS